MPFFSGSDRALSLWSNHGEMKGGGVTLNSGNPMGEGEAYILARILVPWQWLINKGVEAWQTRQSLV
ncbi:MAG: hypothetical protein RID09_24715 [Coleofasciculus sp. G1-WW12-02]|uniref:hypothetical protein n=1 Tax=Coleofasciculus sp. G1-WW12-02 TaxID=3068483 RepID=UPI0032F3B5D2